MARTCTTSRRPGARFLLVSRTVPALCLLFSLGAQGADSVEGLPSDGSTAEVEERRGFVFPPRLRRDAVEPNGEPLAVEQAPVIVVGPDDDDDDDPNRPAIEPPVEGVDAEAPAAELPGDSIWEYVDRMEGELPTEAQVEALEEIEEVELAEKRLIDDLSGGAAPVDFYKDPRAVMAVHPLFLDQVDPTEFDIPIVVNEEVEKWVKYFTGNGRKYYAKWMSRSTRYRPMMYRELDKAGLPRDLVYLSMIESGYNAHAYSHAAAAGLWQFIPSTAKLYKMRVDWWIDDRRDPETSVGAAIAFLGELHKMFGKWELAWAAYNGGPGRIRRATSQADSKDFWVLARGPYLHPETDNYVPKIMAAAIIGKHPERYGFTDISFQEELVYEKAKVDGSVSLEVLAECAGISVDELKALNPALRRFATPPEGYEVRLPRGKRDAFLVAVANVPVDKRVAVARHTVQRGETLSTIASRYKVSVSDISTANDLKNVNRIYVGMSLVVPVDGDGERVAALATSTRTDAAPVSAKASQHTVRRGDTLSGIASKYGVSVEQIRASNGLKSSTIMVGQTLKLGGSSSSSSGGSASAAVTTYKVKPGDSLSGIASRHKVSTADLQRWNGIRDASHIKVGQALEIRGGSASSGASSASTTTTYTVKSGDSLGAIATRHGCTVKQLQEWNGLKSTVIQPGQKLKIKG